ncbi:beta-N-acetylhexosaminidase [Microbulbifer hydrolyticus]|uniref:Beta-hexosaminidase n=1 Tax=Microbulbifer hydrolyticus TaxID=48074 RepID=A0A6P1TB43_9GAMM|nr:beta-N-acetylhexosaminidase [Microbulbifer hydrolyticus]MBB5210568.1 beta-N-acetylhexosaminidase [Microbulbifer hydrolyticus]QHQ38965.1 beta-N-acetylhexosaminidase [Microbulbifer hydrolyticus]
MSVQIGPVMIDVESTELTEEDRELLRHPQVGGLIFFARNFRDRPQLEALVSEIRAVRPEILLAVDQEGGRVQRFKDSFTRIPSMQALSARADSQQLKDVGWLLAAELLAVGVDFSFAPVLDADDDFCRIVGDRSFACDPLKLAAKARPFMAGMHEAGMATTGKHFPGHGQVLEDSHEELPVDQRELEDVLASDGKPFEECIAAGELEAVMPAHIRFAKVDENPVGFSRFWLQEILRKRLGFDGVIFSDDLTMEGAGAAGGYAARIRAAMQAGCDMGVVCNNRQGALEVLKALEGYVPDPHSSKRLERMRGRPAIDSWAALETTPRWLETRRWLESWM